MPTISTISTGKKLQDLIWKSSRLVSGFSLLEIIIVLGLIGSIFAMMMRGLTFTASSRISRTLTELSSLMKAAFDEAVISGRLLRLNVDLVSGQYWLEQTEANLPGFRLKFIQDERTNLPSFEDLETEFNRQRKRNPQKEESYFTVRSFLLNQRFVFQSPTWGGGNDAKLYRPYRITSDLAVTVFQTEMMVDPVQREEGVLEQVVTTYFFPTSRCISTAITLTQVDVEKPLIYTLLNDPNTGKVSIEEGLKTNVFQKSL